MALQVRATGQFWSTEETSGRAKLQEPPSAESSVLQSLLTGAELPLPLALRVLRRRGQQEITRLCLRPPNLGRQTAEAQPCGVAWLRRRGPRAGGPQRPGDAPRPQLRRAGRAAGGAGPGAGLAGRGGGAAGCSRAPPRLRAASRRPGVPVQPQPAADGGGGAGARGPARAPGAARSAREPPAGRDPGPEGETGGQTGWGGSKNRERPPLPRAVAEAAGDPRLALVRPLCSLVAPRPSWRGRGTGGGLCAWSPPRPRPPPSPPLPIPGRAPPASQAHALGPASTRSPPPTWLLRDPGARFCLSRPRRQPRGRRLLAGERSWKYAGLSPRTPEDITPAGGWRR